MAKFTSEDLLKAMGLKVGDTIKFDNKEYVLYKNDYQGYHSYVFREVKPFGNVIKLINLLDWNYTIIQPKPTLTEDEKVILKNLPKYIINIYRDRAQNLFVGSNDGSYTRIYYQHMFDFIKVGDGCYSIEELLKE